MCDSDMSSANVVPPPAPSNSIISSSAAPAPSAITTSETTEAEPAPPTVIAMQQQHQMELAFGTSTGLLASTIPAVAAAAAVITSDGNIIGSGGGGGGGFGSLGTLVGVGGAAAFAGGGAGGALGSGPCLSPNGGTSVTGGGINIDELILENMTLRDKLKEVTTDRDRLLCEVANLRLELDMAELKRLPEESFPQKVIDRSGSGQYALPAPGSISSSSSSGGVGGYVYLQQQQHYTPPPAPSAQQIIYQQHHQMCHQSVHHHHLHHGHHHGGAVVIAGSGVGTGVGGSIQTLHKKNSVRNSGDVLKRSRAQTAYELSQDLLEKQIELLERKYGGLRARNAAITIQRAFRHYMMVKKFASITAMAKAEKRLSRRMMMISTGGTPSSGEDGPPSNSSSSAYGSAIESQTDASGSQQSHHSQQQLQQQPRVCATITAGPPGCHPSSSSRIPPTRSMSLRERRQLDASPIPRSQSGNTSPMPPASSSSAWSQSSTVSGVTSSNLSHPHVNLLHASEQHYYSTPSQCQQQPQYHYQGQGYHSVPHDASFSSNSSHLDSSINSSWTSHNSPHTPYYTAQQIYMRPRGGQVSNSSNSGKRVPPEVPKRTSSITSQQQHQQQMRQTALLPSMIVDTSQRHLRPNGLCKTSENGSLTSVQSSGSDSSATSAGERIANCDLASDRSNSPQTWKRGTALNSSSNQFAQSPDHLILMSGHATTTAGPVVASDECTSSSHTSAAQYEQHEQNDQLTAATPQNYKVSETIRKRQYRVGLNLFNKKPEKGIAYLIRRGFLENTPQGVARFLISRKGLSRQMIGEYLGNLQNSFNMAVLECFAGELDLSGMQVDVALRKFQAYFRMPGEAQKIERLMEVFSQRYCQCNTDIVARLRSSDTVFVLAFAIIMLNTDLHTPNLKPERRMRIDDFIKNLRGIDDCHDIDRDMLAGIYERVKANEFKPGSDHVTQVMKVQATIVGKKPNLALPHRRLVCYCRLYEIPDINKKERPGVHQREVFLFNDLLVITKIFSKKKSSVTYTFRNSYPLCGMVVTLLDVPNYPYCIRLSQKVDGKVLVTFNARNEHDRCKFAEDLRESISEMDEMEALRIEAELERQKSARGGNRTTGGSENRDSGVADVEVCPCPFQSPQGNEAVIAGHDSAQLKRSALSNSLLDMHEQFGNEKPQRRGSVGSLDSGMSISFQSTTASSASRDNNPAVIVAVAANAAAVAAAVKMRFPPAYHIGGTGSGSGTASGSGSSGQHPGHHPSAGPGIMHPLQAPPSVLSSSSGSSSNSNNSIGAGYHHQQQQQQQQQQPTSGGRIQRERKLSRSDESGRSTEV